MFFYLLIDSLVYTRRGYFRWQSVPPDLEKAVTILYKYQIHDERTQGSAAIRIRASLFVCLQVMSTTTRLPSTDPASSL